MLFVGCWWKAREWRRIILRLRETGGVAQNHSTPAGNGGSGAESFYAYGKPPRGGSLYVRSGAGLVVECVGLTPFFFAVS